MTAFPSERSVFHRRDAENAEKTLNGNRGLVGGVEFNPAEGTGGMLVDVCHGGGILHQIWAGELSTGG
jgi:hypothetical protein